MKYRKEKKFLTKALNEAIRMQDEHPLSGSANRLVKQLQWQIAELKQRKDSK